MNYFLLQIILISFISSMLSGCEDSPLTEVTEYPHHQTTHSSSYVSLEGIYNALNILKKSSPDNIQLFRVGALTKDRHPIPLIRVDMRKNDKPVRFLFVSGTHGDEAIAVEAVLYTLQKLIAQYVSGHSENFNAVIDIIPVHNPDGYASNRRVNGNGIDLNRNFPFATNLDNYQPETMSLISLINSQEYNLSLFFHSANEAKYNNIIRRPLEYKKMGTSVLNPRDIKKIETYTRRIIEAGNLDSLSQKWSVHSDLVNSGGIASDWCVSGLIEGDARSLIRIPCKNPHPSFTLELTYPKQPQDPAIIDHEKEELYRIILHLLNESQQG